MGQLVAPAAVDQTMQDTALAGGKPYAFLRRLEKILHPAVGIGRRDDRTLRPPSVRGRKFSLSLGVKRPSVARIWGSSIAPTSLFPASMALPTAE